MHEILILQRLKLPQTLIPNAQPPVQSHQEAQLRFHVVVQVDQFPFTKTLKRLAHWIQSLRLPISKMRQQQLLLMRLRMPRKKYPLERYILLYFNFAIHCKAITVCKPIEQIKLNFILANMDSCFNWRVSMWIFRTM